MIIVSYFFKLIVVKYFEIENHDFINIALIVLYYGSITSKMGVFIRGVSPDIFVERILTHKGIRGVSPDIPACGRQVK